MSNNKENIMNELATPEQLILEALGEASALFMSQEVKGTEIVMPTKELAAIAERTAWHISHLNDPAEETEDE